MVKVEGIELKEIDWVHFNANMWRCDKGSFEEKEHGYFFTSEGFKLFVPEGQLAAVRVE